MLKQVWSRTFGTWNTWPLSKRCKTFLACVVSDWRPGKKRMEERKSDGPKSNFRRAGDLFLRFLTFFCRIFVDFFPFHSFHFLRRNGKKLGSFFGMIWCRFSSAYHTDVLLLIASIKADSSVWKQKKMTSAQDDIVKYLQPGFTRADCSGHLFNKRSLILNTEWRRRWLRRRLRFEQSKNKGPHSRLWVAVAS